MLTVQRLNGVVPNTPSQRPPTGASKRKAIFETPAQPKAARANGMSSPSDARGVTGEETSAIEWVSALCVIKEAS